MFMGRDKTSDMRPSYFQPRTPRRMFENIGHVLESSRTACGEQQLKRMQSGSSSRHGCNWGAAVEVDTIGEQQLKRMQSGSSSRRGRNRGAAAEEDAIGEQHGLVHTVYRSRTKECPWAVNLTCPPNRGWVHVLSSVSAFTLKEHPPLFTYKKQRAASVYASEPSQQSYIAGVTSNIIAHHIVFTATRRSLGSRGCVSSSSLPQIRGM